MTGLLSPRLRATLARARLNPRAAEALTGIGERRSRVKGSGIEFEDFRAYQPGDSSRSVDSRLYMLTGQTYVKQYATYRQLRVSILLDTTSSMGYGSNPKHEFARKVAAGLAYVALAGGDSVVMGTFGDGAHWHPPTQGVNRAGALEDWLSGFDAGGACTPLACVRHGARYMGRSGLTIVISDWMTEDMYDAVTLLQDLGQEIVGLHVLAPEEIEPDLHGAGDYVLVDGEGDASVEVSLGEDTLVRYQEELASWSEELRAWLGRREARYFFVRSDEDVDVLFGSTLRSEGLLL